jgi:hypothetical protein
MSKNLPHALRNVLHWGHLVALYAGKWEVVPVMCEYWITICSLVENNLLLNSSLCNLEDLCGYVLSVYSTQVYTSDAE